MIRTTISHYRIVEKLGEDGMRSCGAEGYLLDDAASRKWEAMGTA